ncbi:MAG: low molecular weight phosphotyrosine protein phosphatase [Bacteroidetes bacterium]|nr:low molecular weight phosphotyrosine protein phosphatase [Bacteroidota bacterium]
MVCLGNICRSPMADGLLRRKVKEHNLNVLVDSAGTANYHVGSQPDHRMIETAKSRGTNIHDLRARQFSKKDFQEFDVIYVMDESNLSNVNQLSAGDNEREKVKLILDELHPNEKRSVPDPYYGSMHDFMDVYDLLDKVTDVIIEKIKNGEIR